MLSNPTSSIIAQSVALTSSTQSHSWSREDLYPVCSGLLMALSFPPMVLSFVAFVALVPLFLYLDKPASFSRTVRAGLLTSATFFGVTLSWLNSAGSISWLAFPAYVAVVAVHMAGFFCFVLPVVALRNYLGLPFLFTAPFAWVACERLRAYGDLAAPWTNIGYSLTNVPFFLQFADIVGIYGVSFWLVTLNVLLFEAIRARRESMQFPKYAALWLTVFSVVNLYNAARWIEGVGPIARHVNVAVIQPNVPQRIKWDDRYGREILHKTFALNAAATNDLTDLVIWPETAIPYYVDERRPFSLSEMGTLPPLKAHILTGLLYASREDNGDTRFYNAAAMFDSSGALLQRYKKIYLVPATERYPFRSVLGFTRPLFNIQEIDYGAMDSGVDRTIFSLPGGAKFAAMICYESAFPQLSREFRLRGAQFLVNITNDAWFGRSFASYQHASFLVMRAIENRTAIVRCGNTGISGFLDPLGRWQQKTALFTEAVIAERIPLTSHLPFYTRFGDLIVYVSYGVLGLYILMALRKKCSVPIANRRTR
jgi:apolipoprotein N-acyltransferase